MKNNTIKKALAGAMALVCVAGAMPANVGGILKNSIGIVANATETTVYPDIYVAGNGEGGFVNNQPWDSTYEPNKMTCTDGVYTITYNSVAAGTYLCKFVSGGTWYGYSGTVQMNTWLTTDDSSDNITFTLDEATPVTLVLDTTGENWRFKILKSATAEIEEAGLIKKQPEDVEITSKQNVTFSVGAAEGCTYQWYYRKDENDQWRKLKTSISTSPSLTLVGNSSRDGYQFFCKVTNGEEIESSEIVTFNYNGLITKHPTDVTIYSNQNATFEVEAENGCTYQWYYRKDKNDKWRKVKTGDSTSASLTMVVNSSKDGYQYRCKVTKDGVSENSKIVTLNYSSLITMQPEDQTVGVNEEAVFNVEAIDDCSYQWYYRKSETDKWIKLKTDNSTSASLTFKGTHTRDGYQFRCKVMNDDGASVSDVVTLNILD